MESPVTAPEAAPAAEPVRPHLTENAVAQVKKVIEAQGYQGFYFAMRVVPSGCSGLGYDLNLVKESKPGDILWEQDGIQIAMDPMSGRYLSGTEVDYTSSLQGAGFKFKNPNAQQSCGCGQTFSA